MKATISNYYVRDCFSQLSEIVNARQEINRGKSGYGVNWKFVKVDRTIFIELLNGKEGWIDTLEGMQIHITTPIFAVETKSGKIIEVDKNDIGKFTNL